MKTARWTLLTVAVAFGVGCDDTPEPEVVPIADGIFATPGEILPSATDEQRATFERGESVVQTRFGPEEGLGPLFNVTFCGACHEKPVFGGSAGRYRDFYIYGTTRADGSFIHGGSRGGILAAYGTEETRPMPEAGADTFGLRNPIPFFGIGLLAELPEEVILANADPDDADGDGISGRPNFDRGFVGRFGTKSQTVSIEGFIRGPIFNHMGLTSDPLTEEMRARLPVPSNRTEDDPQVQSLTAGLSSRTFHQAAAPSEPLTDDDGVPDPELDAERLFDMVSWVMLLAAPQPSEPTPASERGREVFDALNCSGCHVPSLVGPRGAIPAYSDLLLHDMGPEMADGITMGVATASEFRTAPLWGVAVTGPYMHDGRADTLDEAIRAHGGEAERSRDAYLDAPAADRVDLIAFLESLGGAEVRTEGLILPDTPVPEVGEMGGPIYDLTPEEQDLWMTGRAVFDRDVYLTEGLGPFFNGDSCRACHFEPAVGGAGPRGVNAMRHGFLSPGGDFVYPDGGNTGLAKYQSHGRPRPEAPEAAIFESRQTPSIFGVGELAQVQPEAIVELADPGDADGDGIRGVAHFLADGRLGRFGWKAQIPDMGEFVADAIANELGMTLDPALGLSFAFTTDDDDVPDPEFPTDRYEALLFYVSNLAAPHPKQDVEGGEALFTRVGCDACHVPRLRGLPQTSPAAYTDLLLHAVGDDALQSVADGEASVAQFRTPPLWGLSGTGPYMHNGAASTVEQAIMAHAGEAEGARMAFEALEADERSLLLTFLESL